MARRSVGLGSLAYLLLCYLLHIGNHNRSAEHDDYSNVSIFLHRYFVAATAIQLMLEICLLLLSLGLFLLRSSEGSPQCLAFLILFFYLNNSKGRSSFLKGSYVEPLRIWLKHHHLKANAFPSLSRLPKYFSFQQNNMICLAISGFHPQSPHKTAWQISSRLNFQVQNERLLKFWLFMSKCFHAQCSKLQCWSTFNAFFSFLRGLNSESVFFNVLSMSITFSGVKCFFYGYIIFFI